jgi:membrane protease YdiL (CAAX protease family)
MNEAPSAELKWAVALAGATSLAVLYRLFLKHIDGRPLLEYEPRRPVPWNVLAPLVMLAPLVFAMSAALWTVPALKPSAELEAATGIAALSAAGAPPAGWFSSFAVHAALRDMLRPASEATRLWGQSAAILILALAGFVLLMAAFKATSLDLGLPTSWRQLGRDVKIGAAACAALLVPIYAILYLLNEIFQPTEGHPLIQQLLVNHSLGMMAAAAFTAVVAAPIYEETAFRLIFQGWLERGEAPTPPLAEMEPIYDNGALPAKAVSSQRMRHQVSWAPILLSSLLFGLAHYGHGVSPAPLVLLGMVLGYVYQRTHRIVPCIVCHMLFNAFTFVMLALQFAAKP